MFLLWILLIIVLSYLISLSVISSIHIDGLPDNATIYEKINAKSTLMNRIFWASLLIMSSIWGVNRYFSVYPSNPFTPEIAKQLIAADDDENFIECVNSFSGIGPGYTMMSLKKDVRGDFSFSEVKLVCTCIKDKYKKTDDYKLYTDLVYWKECTTYCQTDSCDAGKEHFKDEYEEVVFELGRLLYPP